MHLLAVREAQKLEVKVATELLSARPPSWAAAGSSRWDLPRTVFGACVWKEHRLPPLICTPPPGPNELGPSLVTSFSLETESVIRSVMSESLGTHGLKLARLRSLSLGFSRQEHESEVPCSPPPGHLPDPGVSWDLLPYRKIVFYCPNVPPKCPDTHISHISVGASTC